MAAIGEFLYGNHICIIENIFSSLTLLFERSSPHTAVVAIFGLLVF